MISYLPCALNKLEDHKSRRRLDSSGWMLNINVFLNLCYKFTIPRNRPIASQVFHQLRKGVSQNCNPYSIVKDALSVLWIYSIVQISTADAEDTSDPVIQKIAVIFGASVFVKFAVILCPYLKGRDLTFFNVFFFISLYKPLRSDECFWFMTLYTLTFQAYINII